MTAEKEGGRCTALGVAWFRDQAHASLIRRSLSLYPLGLAVWFGISAVARAEPPRCLDDRLVIELVAKEPDIVTPTGIAVDEAGRVWVIENNTHERPTNYKGPPSDRVRIFSDFDANGHARKATTFAEGFRNAMSLAIGPNDAVYIAERSAIYRLWPRDSGIHGQSVYIKGQEDADLRRVIVRLDTKATYPHNGLAGFAFDELGHLYFGLGENLGVPYKLTGSDGRSFQGGGEGGSVYRCRLDGSGLERIATGFWNPFHQAVDAFGRLFIVDNDPDSRGPCRLVHVVMGGDYGYRYRNGRKGLHPFTAWNGELPGTLPMTAGTGEAPCAVVPYESVGLPAEYRGDLLTTSWGDHVIERFRLRPSGASVRAEAQTLARGGDDFRPVGMVTAPDGSLYVSDWVDKSYPVHGKGRIWRIRMKSPPKSDGLGFFALSFFKDRELAQLLDDPRKDIRAMAADLLAQSGDKGRQALADTLRHSTNVRARLHALWALAKPDSPDLRHLKERNPPDQSRELIRSAIHDPAPEVRAEAVEVLGDLLPLDPSRRDEHDLLDRALKDPSPAVRQRAMLTLRKPGSLEAVVPYLADPDPFLVAAALEVLGRPGHSALLTAHAGATDPHVRVGILLALRRAGEPADRALLPRFLADPDPGVRRAAIQWVGEERLEEYSSLLKTSASRAPVTRELFEALLASEEMLRGVSRKPRDELGGDEYVARVVRDPGQTAAVRAVALRMLRPDHPALRAETLDGFLKDSDPDLRHEAVRALALRSDEPSQELLRGLASDRSQEPEARSAAILGLALSVARSSATRKVLLPLLNEPKLEREALRSLREVGTRPDVESEIVGWWRGTAKRTLAADRRRELAEQLLLALRSSQGGDSVKSVQAARQLAGPLPQGEKEWRQALAGEGDAVAGERVFFHPHGPRCFACHRVDGRGGAIGPELSFIGRSTSREKIIESILTPSKEIAPQYLSWQIATRDGRLHTGVIVEEGPNSTITIADAQARLETINRAEVEERHALTTSIMPDNLAALMTRGEFRDLVAFLCQRK